MTIGRSGMRPTGPRGGVPDRSAPVSTAGGAFLEWMEGKTLPGVAALEAA